MYDARHKQFQSTRGNLSHPYPQMLNEWGAVLGRIGRPDFLVDAGAGTAYAWRTPKRLGVLCAALLGGAFIALRNPFAIFSDFHGIKVQTAPLPTFANRWVGPQDVGDQPNSRAAAGTRDHLSEGTPPLDTQHSDCSFSHRSQLRTVQLYPHPGDYSCPRIAKLDAQIPNDMKSVCRVSRGGLRRTLSTCDSMRVIRCSHELRSFGGSCRTGWGVEEFRP
jgi:hypothetical protein